MKSLNPISPELNEILRHDIQRYWKGEISLKEIAINRKVSYHRVVIIQGLMVWERMRR